MGKIGPSLPEVAFGRRERNSHNTIRAIGEAGGIWRNTRTTNSDGAEAEHRWHVHPGGLEAFVRETGVDSLAIAACASASGCPAGI
jgi:hypothetical protein